MYKKLLLNILLILTASCGVQQTFTVDHSSSTTYILPLDLSDGFPHVMLEVGGHRIPALLDLGGFTTIALSDSILNFVEHRITGSRSVDDAYGNTYSARNYVLPKVRIGDLNVRDIEGTEVKHAVEPRSYAKNGYLGWQFISKFKRVILDYSRSRVILSNDESMPNDYRDLHWITTAFRDKGGAVSNVQLNGVEAEVWWDTGANWCIVDPSLTLPKVDRSYQGNRQFVSPHVRMNGSDLGQLDFYPLDLSGPGTDALIGHNFFAKFIVMLDLERKEISVAQ